MPTMLRVDSRTCCQRCGHPKMRGAAGCRRCADWPPLEFEARSAFEYSGAVRQSIIRMKYHGEYARAGWHAAQLVELLHELDWDVDALVPVPLHPKRLRSRGYNQADKLAIAMGELLELEVIDGLIRTRDTPSQITQNGDQRLVNVAGAFAGLPLLAGRRALLIDDISTTCATILECAFACELAGTVSVRALTIATDV